MRYTVQIDDGTGGESEVVVLDEEDDASGDLVGIRASVRWRPDGADGPTRTLVVALVNRDFNSPIYNQGIRLEGAAATPLEQATDSSGVAEFPLSAWGEFVISLPDSA